MSRKYKGSWLKLKTTLVKEKKENSWGIKWLRRKIKKGNGGISNKI